MIDTVETAHMVYLVWIGHLAMKAHFLGYGRRILAEEVSDTFESASDIQL